MKEVLAAAGVPTARAPGLRSRRGRGRGRLPRRAARALRRQDRRAGRGQGRARHRVAVRGRGRRPGQALRAGLRRGRPPRRDRGGDERPRGLAALPLRRRRGLADGVGPGLQAPGRRRRGPNTGGMGAYSPVPAVDAAEGERLAEALVAPTLARAAPPGHRLPRRPLRRPDAHARGAQGARVQRALRRSGGPGRAAPAHRRPGRRAGQRGCGRHARPAPTFGDDAAVTVVCAAPGYPAAPRTGDLMEGLEAAGRRARRPGLLRGRRGRRCGPAGHGRRQGARRHRRRADGRGRPRGPTRRSPRCTGPASRSAPTSPPPSDPCRPREQEGWRGAATSGWRWPRGRARRGRRRRPRCRRGGWPCRR